MIIDKIKGLFFYKAQNRERSFEITKEGIRRMLRLSPKAGELLIMIINRIEPDATLESFIVTGTYQDFLYDKRQAFYRDRDRLVDAEFLYVEGDRYLVNFCLLDYTSRRQRDYFRELFGIKKVLRPSLGGTHK